MDSQMNHFLLNFSNENTTQLTGSDAEEDSMWLSNRKMVALTLLTIYFLILIGGVFGNGSILVTLFTSGRMPRNPLLVGLCLSDILVSGISAPVTVMSVVFQQGVSWKVSTVLCKLIHYFQNFPVASSTICHLMLSIDRYSTVRHPRVLQLRKKHVIPILFALFAWLSAGLLSVPFLFIYQSNTITTSSTTITTTTTTFVVTTEINDDQVQADDSTITITNTNNNINNMSNKIESGVSHTTPIPFSSFELPPNWFRHHHWNLSTRSMTHHHHHHNHHPSRAVDQLKRRRICTHDLSTVAWYSSFILIHTVCVFFVPGFGILINHLRVRKKLCALSLTARAAHGELPLPMPLLRRPTHVIIVTGMANNNALVRPATSASYTTDNRRRPDVKRKPTSKRLGRRPAPQTATGAAGGNSSSITNTNTIPSRISSSRNVQQQQPMGNPEFPLPQTSTLRARKRLANILITSAFLFIFCWAPYAVSIVYCQYNMCSKSVLDFGLLIGYTYSALNPIIYFTLNHNSLRQSLTCSLCSRILSVRRFFRLSFGGNSPVGGPPSSTNEAALGAFNPRFIKPKQQTPLCKEKESSHFVY